MSSQLKSMCVSVAVGKNGRKDKKNEPKEEKGAKTLHANSKRSREQRAKSENRQKKKSSQRRQQHTRTKGRKK